MLRAADDPRVVLIGVFALAFPSVVYCLLAGIGLTKLAQLSGHLR